MIIIDDALCGSSIEVTQGETLMVRLREQGVSGYRWTVEAVEGLPLRDSECTSGGDRPGAAGYREFRFQANKPGTHVLRLKRWRDWQGEDSVVERCQVEVRVK